MKVGVTDSKSGVNEISDKSSKSVALTLRSLRGMGMVLREILDQHLSSYYI